MWLHSIAQNCIEETENSNKRDNTVGLPCMCVIINVRRVSLMAKNSVSKSYSSNGLTCSWKCCLDVLRSKRKSVGDTEHFCNIMNGHRLARIVVHPVICCLRIELLQWTVDCNVKRLESVATMWGKWNQHYARCFAQIKGLQRNVTVVIVNQEEDRLLWRALGMLDKVLQVCHERVGGHLTWSCCSPMRSSRSFFEHHGFEMDAGKNHEGWNAVA